jgi:hypothetical protein
MTGVPAGHRFGGAVLVRSTWAGACQRGVGCSIGFDLNERVRTAILAFTVAP